MDKTIDSILDNFHLESSTEMKGKPISVTLTLWVPVEYKAKYDRIQAKSGKRFAKVLKEVIKKSIDRFDDQAS
jgi:predicted DNA-binding protein